MSFTQGQRDVLERVLGAEAMVRQGWFKRNFKKENLTGYAIAWGLLALLVWNTFFEGPEWAGNIGGFGMFCFYGLSLLLGIILFVMLIHYDSCVTDREEDDKIVARHVHPHSEKEFKARQKFLFGWIKHGSSFKFNFLRSVFMYWGPTMFTVVGGGMWFTGFVGFLAACAMWFTSFIIFHKAYQELDWEMGQDDGTGQTTAERDAEREDSITIEGAELLLKD